MNNETLLKQTKKHLHYLCSDISERRVGSEGNRQATGYVKNTFQKSGWETEETLLSVMDWKTDGASLRCGQEYFAVFSSPYSLDCSVEGELLSINNFEDYYSVPGQMKYIEQNEGRFNTIVLNINIDGAGYKEGLSGFSAFQLPEGIQNKLTEVIQNNPGIVEGLPWVQGDHSIPLRKKHPEWFMEDMTTLFQMLKDQKIKPLIAARYPLEKAAEVHQMIERADAKGKIVFDVLKNR